MSATILSKRVLPLAGDYDVEERRYSIVFTLATTSAEDGPLSLYVASGMPIPFVSYYETDTEFDQNAICQRLVPRQIGPKTWEVTAEYSTRMETRRRPQDHNLNPLQRSLRWRFSPRDKQKVLKQDLDGKFFRNSAGTPYDPEVATVEAVVGVLNIWRNEIAPNWALWNDLANSVNSDPFWNAPAGTAKFKYPTPEPKWEAGVDYIETMYEFEIDPEGWLRERDDFGPEYKVQVAGKWERRLFSELGGGTAMGGWLNPNGTAVDEATRAVYEANPAAAPKKTFRVFKTRSFAILGL